MYEFNKIIPKYCFYILLKEDNPEYSNQLSQGVIISVNQRVERLVLWISENFNLKASELEVFKGNDYYDIRFLSLRTDKTLQLYMKGNKV